MTTCPCCNRIVRGAFAPGWAFYCAHCTHACERCRAAEVAVRLAANIDQLQRSLMQVAEAFERTVVPKLLDLVTLANAAGSTPPPTLTECQAVDRESPVR